MTIKNKACKRRKLATNIEQEKQQPDCQVFRQCLSQNTVVKSYVGYIVLLETGTLKYQLLWPVMFRSFCSLLSLEAPLRFFFFFSLFTLNLSRIRSDLAATPNQQ